VLTVNRATRFQRLPAPFHWIYRVLQGISARLTGPLGLLSADKPYCRILLTAAFVTLTFSTVVCVVVAPPLPPPFLVYPCTQKACELQPQKSSAATLRACHTLSSQPDSNHGEFPSSRGAHCTASWYGVSRNNPSYLTTRANHSVATANVGILPTQHETPTLTQC
jgi:hypothetical protein